MRKMVCLFSLLLFTCSLPVPSIWPREQASEKAQPVLVIKNPACQFKQVLAGETLKHTFTIRNEGKAPLRIYEVAPSCDCSTAVFDALIPPGKEGRVQVEIHTEGFQGEFQNEFLLQSNDPLASTTMLVVSGHANTCIKVEPREAILLKGAVKQRVMEKVRLTSNMEKPFRVLGVKSKPANKVSCRIETIAEGRIYDLVVENLSQEPGRYQGDLTITTDCKNQPKITLRLLGIISK